MNDSSRAAFEAETALQLGIPAEYTVFKSSSTLPIGASPWYLPAALNFLPFARPLDYVIANTDFYAVMYVLLSWCSTPAAAFTRCQPQYFAPIVVTQSLLHSPCAPTRLQVSRCQDCLGRALRCNACAPLSVSGPACVAHVCVGVSRPIS